MKPITLLVGIAFLVPIFFAGLVVVPLAIRWASNKFLLVQGTSATAVVVAVSDTGSKINFNPVLQVSLEVSAPDGSTFRAMILQTVSAANSYAFRPEHKLNVKYNPRDRSQVAIVFGTP